LNRKGLGSLIKRTAVRFGEFSGTAAGLTSLLLQDRVQRHHRRLLSAGVGFGQETGHDACPRLLVA
jgi:hypothetical protein